MPGISGLETLTEIKKFDASIPVVMITKSEEEYIMDEAIGSKIADYLIKPVNPNQILLSLKKSLDNSRLVSEKTTANYQQEFRKIAMDLSMVNTCEEWVELYKKLIYWELQLEEIDVGILTIRNCRSTLTLATRVRQGVATTARALASAASSRCGRLAAIPSSRACRKFLRSWKVTSARLPTCRKVGSEWQLRGPVH